MLLDGSIRAVAVALVCVACVAHAQHYDYSVSDDGPEGDSPDYSRYYKQDSSAPLVAGLEPREGDAESSGFVSPLDFNGFFGAANFGLGSATNQQQVFRPAQQNSSGFVSPNEFQAAFGAAPAPFANANNFQNFFQHQAGEPSPGPSYVSQKILPESKRAYELDDLNAPRSHSGVYRNKEVIEEPEYRARAKPKQPIRFTSTASAAVPKHLGPYKKYSFQPTAATFRPSAPFALASTPAAKFASVASASEPEPEAQAAKAGSNCRRVERQVSPEDLGSGRFRRDADGMQCYVCDDPSTGGSFERCSYTSAPEEDEGNYYRSHAQKYTSKRVRRAASPARGGQRRRQQRQERQDEDAEYINPFEEEKKNEHGFNSKPDEFDADARYTAPDFGGFKEDYRFGPEYFADASADEKSYSEQQSDQLKKSPENCKKVQRDALTCMVCADPKTGGNYEQCSYSSEPQEKKYAYVKERKYNSNDPDPAEEGEGTEHRPEVRGRAASDRAAADRSTAAKQKRKKKKVAAGSAERDGGSYEIPRHFEASTHQQQKRRYSGLNPELYGSTEESDRPKGSAPAAAAPKEDYVARLFPEYAEHESRQRQTKQPRPGYQIESSLPEYFTAEESKRDVDSVLAEFSKKDRSNCKKIARDKMTCYQCIDAKGVQHEECMFVSESQPKSSHVAYHEVKEFSTDPAKRKQSEESASESKKTDTKVKQHRPAASEPVVSSAAVQKPLRQARRKTNLNRELAQSESRRLEVRAAPPHKNKKEAAPKEAEPELSGVQTESPDGAYASELVPRYSKKLGVTLPAYMLDVSEHERDFDEVVRTG